MEKQIETTLRFHLNLPEWQKSTKQQTGNAGGLGMRDPSSTVGGLQIVAVTMETGVGSSQKDKNKSTI